MGNSRGHVERAGERERKGKTLSPLSFFMAHKDGCKVLTFFIRRMELSACHSVRLVKLWVQF